MIVNNQAGVEYPATLDVTKDPEFLGEPPADEGDESCDFCERTVHELDGVALTPRGFHRFDFGGFGYFADELTAGAR